MDKGRSKKERNFTPQKARDETAPCVPCCTWNAFVLWFLCRVKHLLRRLLGSWQVSYTFTLENVSAEGHWPALQTLITSDFKSHRNASFSLQPKENTTEISYNGFQLTNFNLHLPGVFSQSQVGMSNTVSSYPKVNIVLCTGVLLLWLKNKSPPPCQDPIAYQTHFPGVTLKLWQNSLPLLLNLPFNQQRCLLILR